MTQTRALLGNIAERRAELEEQRAAPSTQALDGLDDLERDARAILAKARRPQRQEPQNLDQAPDFVAARRPEKRKPTMKNIVIAGYARSPFTLAKKGAPRPGAARRSRRRGRPRAGRSAPASIPRTSRT